MKLLNKDNCAEVICFLIFCVCTIFISFYHEPWRDEFQAWADSAETLKNIVFVMPHLDGHPPLWYIILKFFSVFNINPELCLKIPNLLFMFSAVWLLIFKSPFARIIKLTLPFTYFIFYQYSIISRPYSILCFALFLAACFYKDKNNYPFRYIFALILLGLSSAFGVMLSVGIVIVWLIEIIKEEKFSFIKTIFKDKRIAAILIHIAVCLFIILLCISCKNNLFRIFEFNFVKLLYTIFGILSDSLITDIKYYGPISKINVFAILSGFIIYTFLFYIFKLYKSLLLFTIPYLLFLITAYLIYFCGHHLGIIFVFYIFVFWCALNQNCELKKDKRNKLIIILIFIPIIVQIYWSICAYYHEYRYDYSCSRSLARYIKENELAKYDIVNYFLKYNPNFQYVPVCVNPYFGKNIFYNFNMLSPDKKYIIHKTMNEEELKNINERILKIGFPKVITGDLELVGIGIPKEYSDNPQEALKAINKVFLTEIFDVNEEEIPEYKIAKIINYSHIWKSKRFEYVVPVFIRED